MLPMEIYIKVYELLEEEDVLSFKLTCKMFNKITNDVAIYGNRIMKKYKQNFKKPLLRNGIRMVRDIELQNYLDKKNFFHIFFKNIEGIDVCSRKYLNKILYKIIKHFVHFWRQNGIRNNPMFIVCGLDFRIRMKDATDEEREFLELANPNPLYPLKGKLFEKIDKEIIKNKQKISSHFYRNDRMHFMDIPNDTIGPSFSDFSNALYFLGVQLHDPYFNEPKEALYMNLYVIINYVIEKLIKESLNYIENGKITINSIKSAFLNDEDLKHFEKIDFLRL